MRILHFSWEYPPVMYGGLGTHVLALTQEQARRGHQVTVITQAVPGDPDSSCLVDGVWVIRVANYYEDALFTQANFDYWVHGFALASQQACDHMEIAPEVIHAHDWVTAVQLEGASTFLSVPSVLTIHATEFGRHNGWLASKLSRHVYARERKAIAAADAVIVCSEFMSHEIRNGYGVAPKKLEVIPNGIQSMGPVAKNTLTDRHDGDPDEFVIGFLGRLEWEKGVHHVIDGMALIQNRSIRLEIAGIGSQVEELRNKVARKDLNHRVSFLGHIQEVDRIRTLQSWDVAVIPSSYEPFGIVALELGQLRVSLITSHVGGLADIVPSSDFGYPIKAIDGASIALKINSIFDNPVEARERADRLAGRIESRYTWNQVATATDRVYEVVTK